MQRPGRAAAAAPTCWHSLWNKHTGIGMILLTKALGVSLSIHFQCAYAFMLDPSCVGNYVVERNVNRMSLQSPIRSTGSLLRMSDGNPQDELMENDSVDLDSNFRRQPRISFEPKLNNQVSKLSPYTNSSTRVRSNPKRNVTSSSRTHATNRNNHTNSKSKDTTRTNSNYRRRSYSPAAGSTTSNLSEEEERQRRDRLEAQMDAFLSGEDENELWWEAEATVVKPNIVLSPSETVEISLRELRKYEEKDYDKHDIVSDTDERRRKNKYIASTTFARFLAPLSRSERWGMSHKKDPWKEVLRSTGFLTPLLLVRRLRSSPFSVLLDWETLSVTDGLSLSTTTTTSSYTTLNVAFVNAALFFGEGMEPCLVQFRLKKHTNGVWLIDHATISKKDLFWNKHASDTHPTL